jgi:hypothetical protein
VGSDGDEDAAESAELTDAVEGLAAADEADEPDEAPDRFDRWRKESTIGNVGTGIARGLQAVFAPPAHEIAIVAAVPGEPPDADQRLRVILDPDDPTKSIAVVPAPPTGTGPEAAAGTPSSD